MREGASGGGVHVHQSCRRRLMPPIPYLKFSGLKKLDLKSMIDH
jgi:hypothetical protein